MLFQEQQNVQNIRVFSAWKLIVRNRCRRPKRAQNPSCSEHLSTSVGEMVDTGRFVPLKGTDKISTAPLLGVEEKRKSSCLSSVEEEKGGDLHTVQEEGKIMAQLYQTLSLRACQEARLRGIQDRFEANLCYD